ncbi:hypothetical protein, partial [Pedobacter sp. ASV12]|uniref:hypothetical protein n=1 Tax=Pedobacter sp. ASV12 TaxID=2795120 RepID=UPI001E6332F8
FPPSKTTTYGREKFNLAWMPELLPKDAINRTGFVTVLEKHMVVVPPAPFDQVVCGTVALGIAVE